MRQYQGLQNLLKQQKKEEIPDSDMKKVLKTKFGVKMRFPGFYNDQAIIVPHMSDLVMSTGFHIIPKN